VRRKGRRKVKRRDNDYEALLEEERLILDATESIHLLMDEQELNRAELARRVGVSKGHISQLLDGKSNMTLRTLARLMKALGHRAHIESEPLAGRNTMPEPVQSWKVHQYAYSTRCTYVYSSRGVSSPAEVTLRALEGLREASPVLLAHLRGAPEVDEESTDLLAGVA
jgi:transcriptional regulator with XRE-family HTH domain